MQISRLDCIVDSTPGRVAWKTANFPVASGMASGLLTDAGNQVESSEKAMRSEQLANLWKLIQVGDRSLNFALYDAFPEYPF